MSLFFHGKHLCVVAMAALLGCMPMQAAAAPAAAPVTATPAAPAPSGTPAAPVITDDLVNAPPSVTPNATPEPAPEQPRPQVVQPKPGIDYSLPGSPDLPVLPGAKVINPTEIYVLPPAGELPRPEEEDVEVVMPATPGVPSVNGTLLNGTMVNGTFMQESPLVNGTMVNGTIPVHGSNATIIPLAPGFTPSQPQANATIVTPQANATQSMRVLTPADFLVKNTTQQPAPIKKEDPKKPEPPQKEDPKKEDPKKPEPPKTPEPPQKAQKPQKGEEMRIPPEAAKTGDVSFLEGCWKGTRPEYNSKRIVTEKFCFDASGVGKRTIIDPSYAGMCYGPTKAIMNKNGVLKMSSGEAACTSGDIWAESEMECRGEGEQTPCKWVFGPKDSQAYKIRFVRE